MNARDPFFLAPATGVCAASHDHQPRLLLVGDDDDVDLHRLRQILEANHQLHHAVGRRCLQHARTQRPDLILLQGMIADPDALTLCQLLKTDVATCATPVLLITPPGSTDADLSQQAAGLDAGAADCLSRPFSPAVVRARIKSHLALAATEELSRSRVELALTLSRASELKDGDTGAHAMRVGLYAEVLGCALGMGPEESEDLRLAAALHDIGKIGIPDSLLHHTGMLDATQRATMCRHTLIGAAIIGEQPSRLLRMARTVALQHHERWDGTGYPNGLRGEAIALEARIVAVTDVFDALISRRPYKEAMALDRALATMQEESGHHFDPKLMALFLKCLPDILTIRQRWAD